MSYEGVPKKEAENNAIKLTASQASENKANVPKGFSNQHSVNIAMNNKIDYKSLAQTQQDGHNQDREGRQVLRTDLNQIKQDILKQKKDLRSSHFELGNNNGPQQPTSLMNYQAPPQAALSLNDEAQKKAKERIQKSSFTFKDGTSNSVSKTTQQVQNTSLQSLIQAGNFQATQKVTKPIDSINFGQKIDYKTESKETFVQQQQGQPNQDYNVYRGKFTKNNINFGSTPAKDSMQTVSQTVNREGGVKSGQNLLMMKQQANTLAS